jgi:hypothetical protein
MTIRQYVKRRLFLAFAIAVTAILAMVLTGTSRAGHVPLAVLIGFPVFALAGLLINLGIRCPKCKGNLGITVVPAILTFSKKHKVKYCPFCAASLDEEV